MRKVLDHAGAVLLGYVGAVLAAGFSYIFLLAFAIQVTGSIGTPSEQSAGQQIYMLIYGGWLAALLISLVAAVPSLVAAIALILLDRTDMISHALAGLLVSIAATWITAEYVLFMQWVETNFLTLASGAIAGIAYWFIGRKLRPAPKAAG